MKKFAKRCVGVLCIVSLLVGFVPIFGVSYVSAENTGSISPADLFVANSGVVSITPNVDFPDYSSEGNGVQILVNDDASFKLINASINDTSPEQLGKSPNPIAISSAVKLLISPENNASDILNACS